MKTQTLEYLPEKLGWEAGDMIRFCPPLFRGKKMIDDRLFIYLGRSEPDVKTGATKSVFWSFESEGTVTMAVLAPEYWEHVSGI